MTIDYRSLAEKLLRPERPRLAEVIAIVNASEGLSDAWETLALREASRLISGRAGPFGLDDYPGLSSATYIIVESLDGWDANGLKAIASAITANARAAVALFSTTLRWFPASHAFSKGAIPNLSLF